MNLPKKFKFTIYKQDNLFVADCQIGDEERVYNEFAKTEAELFEGVADLFMTILDIKCSWYRRLIYRVFRV